MAIGLALLFLIILGIQVPRLIKKKCWRELAVYLIIFSLAVIYSFGQIWDWNLPVPSKTLEKIGERIWKAILND